MGSSQDGQEVVIDFNRDHMIGAHVQYWTGVREGRGKFSTTRSAAELLGGHTPVVWVASHAACIALTHVEPVPHQPDDIEEYDDKTIPDAERAAKRVLAYVTEFGDGLYDVVGGAPLYGRDLVAVAKAAEQIAKPCGSCHPCENYSALQVAQKIADDNDRLRALLADASAEMQRLTNAQGWDPSSPQWTVIRAGTAWRNWFAESCVRAQSPSDAEEALITAVDDLPGPDHRASARAEGVERSA